jgi:hypothetical protein
VLRRLTLPADLAAGIPAAHCARVLGLDLVEVESILARPPALAPFAFDPQRPISRDTAAKIRVLLELGYTSPDIASFPTLKLHAVEDYLQRLEPVRCPSRTRPRSEAEQRRLDANRLRAEKARAARAANKTDDWRRVAVRDDDADCLPLPSAIAPLADQVAEIVPAPEVPAPAPFEWDGPSDPRACSGERNGRAKVT